MRNIKVVVVPSIPFSLMYGGGETQVVKTCKALSSSGVDVSYLHWEDELQDCDLLHVFGAKYWQTPIIELAKGRGIPVALSTISYAPPSARNYVRLRLKKLFTRLVPIPTTFKLIHKAVTLADVLLPNSVAEGEYLVDQFGVQESKICVIPNAVDLSFANADPVLFRQQYGIQGDFTLCVGKIEPRKNQLKLVETFLDWNQKLILIGDAINNQRGYYNQVLALAKKNPNILHIPRLPHDSGLLSSAYAAARAHVLLGVNETPGLVNLEAGIAGTSLAVLDCPPVREYLGEHAVYIPDLSIKAIRHGIIVAYARGADKGLRQRIEANYTWERAAALTLAAYKQVLLKVSV